MTEAAPGPRVSVLVTVVDGGEILRACLEALDRQSAAPDFEVLVPWDSSVAGIPLLAEDFPHVSFLPLGELATERPPCSPAGQHELFDRRRAAGLSAAGGEVVCILEDRGVPADDWLSRLLHALDTARPTPAVVGGAVECGVDRLLNWAVFFCDFSRYQPPFEAGPRPYVTDVNCAYTRDALDRTRELWRDRYHETTVNWALQREGGILLLSPEPVVFQMRRDLSLGRVLGERRAWGRLFAYTRTRESSGPMRLAYALVSPLLPVVLWGRHLRMQVRKRKRLGTFLAATPLVLLLLATWAVGEFEGYARGRP